MIDRWLPDLWIPIRGRPKPRDGRYGWSGGKHSKSDYWRWKDSVRTVMGLQWKNPPWLTPVVIRCAFLSKRKWTSDVDNLLGGLMDCGEGILYGNDLLVKKAEGQKWQWDYDGIMVWVYSC